MMNASILYTDGITATEFDINETLHDLRIDEIITQITGDDAAAREHYVKKPKTLDDVTFRQAVMKDLERHAMREVIEEFMTRYGMVQTCMTYSKELPQRQTKQKWRLDAAKMYCECLAGLRDGLNRAEPASDGLRRFAACLDEHMKTKEFIALRGDMEQCAARLDAVCYTMDLWLYQNKVAVKAEPGPTDDYCARLSHVFSRYGISAGPKMVPFPGVNMESLELAVLARLGELFPEEFKLLEGFCAGHELIETGLIDAFAAELRFYMDYIAFMDRMKKKGYAFSHAEFHGQKTMRIRAGYDLALALAAEPRVTSNDFTMAAGESFIVTGPNQGGKTAYARMAGQVAYFASLGLPAPCDAVETCLYEGIFTHFAREEDLSNNYGRLKEELQRTKRILDAMPPGSLLIFNDLFSSTTTFDALEIGRKLLGSLTRRGCLCLFVTNFHELADESQGLVCLRAAQESGTGVYRVTRGQAGNAHTNRLISVYRLCYDDIRSRL